MADLENIHCNSCGVLFGVDEGVIALWRESCKTFYCPNGHGLSYPTPTPASNELKELKAEVQSLNKKLAASKVELEDKQKKITELTLELEIWKPATIKE